MKSRPISVHSCQNSFFSVEHACSNYSRPAERPSFQFLASSNSTVCINAVDEKSIRFEAKTRFRTRLCVGSIVRLCAEIFFFCSRNEKKNFANEKLMFEPIKVVFEIARSFLLLLLVVREEIKIRNKKKTKVIHERGNKATYSFKL